MALYESDDSSAKQMGHLVCERFRSIGDEQYCTNSALFKKKNFSIILYAT